MIGSAEIDGTKYTFLDEVIRVEPAQICSFRDREEKQTCRRALQDETPPPFEPRGLKGQKSWCDMNEADASGAQPDSISSCHFTSGVRRCDIDELHLFWNTICIS